MVQLFQKSGFLRLFLKQWLSCKPGFQNKHLQKVRIKPPTEYFQAYASTQTIKTSSEGYWKALVLIPATRNKLGGGGGCKKEIIIIIKLIVICHML